MLVSSWPAVRNKLTNLAHNVFSEGAAVDGQAWTTNELRVLVIILVDCETMLALKTVLLRSRRSHYTGDPEATPVVLHEQAQITTEAWAKEERFNFQATSRLQRVLQAHLN